MTLYRTNFGPVDDGSTDTMEAHDAWSEVQDQVRDGILHREACRHLIRIGSTSSVLYKSFISIYNHLELLCLTLFYFNWFPLYLTTPIYCNLRY